MIEKEILLGQTLVKRSYGRILILGSVLGVTAVVVVLALFASYYHAVERHMLGIHPHLALRKSNISSDDRRSLEVAIRSSNLVKRVTPAIDVVLNAAISQVASHQVVCVDDTEKSSCFDFTASETRSPEGLRSATGFEITRRRVGNIRLRGIVTDSSSAAGISRIMDVRASENDLERLDGPDQGMSLACLFDRTLFHGASRLDDFLVTLPSAGATSETPGTPTSDAGTVSAQAVSGDIGLTFRLLSTLNLGMRRTEYPIFVTSLDGARQLVGRPGWINALEVELHDPYAAPDLARQLEMEITSDGLEIESWIDRDSGSSFQLLEVLRRVIFTVIFSVVVIAALGIVSTLSLVVLENRRKIAILKAMGLRNRSLYLALAIKCWQIATLGLALGSAAGYAASLALMSSPGFRQGLAKLGITEPRVLLQPGDLLLLAIATLVLYSIVALIPARNACRIDAVEGLQS